MRDDGIEVRAFVREVVNMLRTLLLLRAGAREGLGLSDSQLAELTPIAEQATAADIVAALRALGEIDFAGDNYDALPAEIAFAALAVGLPEERDALAPPPGPAAAAPPAGTPPREATESAAAEAPSRAPQQRRRQSSPPAEPRPPQPRAEPARAVDRAPAAASPARPRRGPRPPALPDDEAPSPELSALRDRLSDIRDAARAQHHKAGALLNSRCYIKSLEGDTVEIGFQSPLLVEKALGDAEVLQAIRGAVGGALGRDVEVVPVVWEALQQAQPQQQRADAATPGPGPGPGAGPQDGPPPAEPSRGGGHLVEEARKLGAIPIEE